MIELGVTPISDIAFAGLKVAPTRPVWIQQ